MFPMSTQQSQLDAVVERLQDICNHPFLNQHIAFPPIPKTKLRVLHLYLNHMGWSSERIEVYCTAVTLAQMGLEVHEGIDNRDDLAEADRKRRQLSILAGDYLSSQYYRILSLHGEIQLIDLLAQSIAHINHWKMHLYTQATPPHLPAFLEAVGHIEAELFTCITLLDPNGQPWREWMRNLILVDWIIRKLESGPDSGTYLFSMEELKSAAEERIALLYDMGLSLHESTRATKRQWMDQLASRLSAYTAR